MLVVLTPMWAETAFASPDRLRVDRHLGTPASSDPDEAQFTYAIGSRTHAKGGGTAGFAGRPGQWGFGLAGFLELENLRQGVYAFPWQAYRANVGLRVAWRLDDGADRWFIDAGYFHESDHAADVGSIAKPFGLPEGHFPNATLSTQEYLRLRVGLERTHGCWTRWVRGGTRVYTPNFVWEDQARRDLAFSAEGRLTFAPAPRFGIWASGYAEVVFNRYDGELPLDFRGGPYRYWQLELGVRVAGFDVYSGVRGGNGRGIDFAIVHPASWTLIALRTDL